MELLINVKHFTEPTLETLVEYTNKRIQKLTRYIPEWKNYQPILKISGEFNDRNHYFELKFILEYKHGKLIIQVNDADLRAAVDRAKDNLKVQLERHKRYLNYQ
jgi:ribosomal subunit interface protein